MTSEKSNTRKEMEVSSHFLKVESSAETILFLDFEISHIDEYIDSLLHEDRVCDVILPRIQVTNFIGLTLCHGL